MAYVIDNPSTTRSTLTPARGSVTSSGPATSQDESSKGTCERSTPQISGGDVTSTPSLGLACGNMRSSSQAGQMSFPFGPGVAPANPSASRDAAAGRATSGTYGPHGSGSSASAALMSCLANRLRVLLDSRGSTMFRLTWKERVTPSGRPICALRASARHISGSVYFLWPTPLASNAEQGGSVRHMDGRGSSLSDVVKTTSWATPTARDYRSERGSQTDEELYGSKGRPLSRQVLVADHGQTLTGSPATTRGTDAFSGRL